mgnify:FL=1
MLKVVSVTAIKKTIFLCGPMRGVDRKLSLEWRKKTTKILSPKFIVIHAMRGRELKETFLDYRAAVARDISDIKDADILLVNDTFENVSMIGTSMEIFFAYSLHKPVIIFGNAHEKDYWLNYHSHCRLKDLNEACKVLGSLFS